MEPANRPEVAARFREMERVEELRAEEVKEMNGDSEMPDVQPWELD